ncbi:SdrD B-like domain-containing protein [Dinoroseobacter sp. S76]|uniref:SdrD B-like domain-containing protein n=1 Tax=Dinoroseobacter sp. S76 TaxID=3415124 RepID=UPI003C7DC1F1
MTTRTYEFTAFTEDDLVQQGTIGGGLGEGETFVMPAAATTVISTKDDDNVLSGDYGKDKDDNAKDSSGQIAVINGVEISGEQVYIEKYFVVKGSDGKTYYLAEIEVEDYHAPGQGDDFFTFIGDVPPAGTTLKTIDSCGVKDGIKYEDLGAGPLEDDAPDGECITIEAEDMNDHGFRTVHGDKASGGQLVKIEGNDGKLSTDFDGPSAVYDLTLYAQDETDGVSKLRVFVDGEHVGTIMLDRQSNGQGSDNSGFTGFTLEGLEIHEGAEIEIQAWKDCGEWVRIDKLELKKVDDLPENEDPSFDNLPDDGVICVDENETFVADIDASDADGDSLTYEIVGGRDGDMFTIDPNTGELSFKTAKDYENPTSGGGNNTYDVTVKVSDGKGGEEVKPLWVKVKDVDEPDPVCIVIEAEDMHLCGYSVEHNGDASGGANIKATGYYGIAETVFNGPAGTYDLSVFSMDENDGNGAIDVFVNGEYVDTIWLDQGNDGGGGANTGSTFSEDVFQDLQLDTGDVISLVGYTDCYEFARIDKIVLCEDGKTCPPDYMKLDFSGLQKGTTVSNQFDGVTISAQKAGDGAGSPNDAMIFDSNNTTGGDGDLGYNGLGNILIISEDNDASDPDDNAGGGTITFDFDAPSDLQNIRLLDIEEHGGTIKLFDEDGNLIKTVAIPAAGNNSNQLVDLNATDVASMEINLVGSGAVDDLCWKPGDPPVELGSLAGRYFCDENDNDIDDGEPGIAGATVELLDAAGNVIGTTTTNANGDYLFEGLEAGTYAVRFAPDADGKTFVAQDQGGDDAVDSDVDPNTGETGPIMLAAGENKTDVDAGVEDPGTAALKGRYFCDENDNDVDDAEPGVSGVTVTLFTAAGVFVADTVTAADGSYEFLGLDAGDYKVVFDADPTGKTFVAQDQGNDDTVDSDVDPNTGETGVISVAIGEVVEDVDAGVEDPGTASLGGRYFCDENDNDIDDSEPAVAGVEVFLLDAAGNVVDSQFTDSNGDYLFTGLEAGTYSVRFAAEPTGKTFVAPNEGNDDTVDSDVDPNTGETGPIQVNIGDAIRDVDAGVEDPGTASVGDTVWFDANGNGLLDGGEAGVSGVSVTLTGAGADGVLGTADDTTATDVTDGNGNYLFDGLDAGTYKVTFDASTTGGLVFTTEGAAADDVGADDSDADQATGMTEAFELSIGEAELDIDAGLVDPGTASLGGRYFCDENDNDIDDSEPAVAGVEVFLLDAAGNVVDSQFTDSNGDYLFTGLEAGTYSVRFDAEPTGKTFVAPNEGNDDTVDSDVDPNTGETGPIQVNIGDAIRDVDAGVEDPGTASLGGRYFCDENDNDIDDSEPAVAGVEVFLLDAAGNVVDSQFTDSNGDYLFTGLDAGTYSVRFDAEPTGKTFVAPNEGNDDTVDSDVDPNTGETGPIQVNIGDAIRDVDAGVEDPGTAALKGRYFCDENDNDVDDAEPGVSGVTVTLLTAAGVFVADTVTAADGSYEFLGLDAGDYKVVFDADPTGKTFVAQDQGNDDTVDSDVDPNTGETGVISVAIGEVVEDVDAGVEDPGTASLGDKVFLDLNGNGVQDAGEQGVADVSVMLLDENGTPIATTTTDDMGMYLFDGLDAGTYSVKFGEPDGFDFTAQDQGGDDAADSDADPTTGETAQVTLAIGDENLTLDAGLVVENGAPTPQDDAGMICANELLTLDVLANDSDPENDALTVTAVNGTSITEGQTINVDGVFITLSGGQLVFDGEAAFIDLDIGDTADVQYTYTVSDGMGNFSDAFIDVAYCGTAEDLEDIAASLPVQVNYQIIDEAAAGTTDGFTIKVTGSGDARLDDIVFEAAYCASAFDPADGGTDFTNAPILTGDLYVAEASLLPDNVLAGQTGINGQSAEDNLDLINWILNQDFQGQGYTDFEVQGAIWSLTDSIDFIRPDLGELEDVREIVALAEANGEGFVAGEGDVVGLMIDPNPASSTNSQPFIIGIDFNDIDCLC